jgi:hypothetical protein
MEHPPNTDDSRTAQEDPVPRKPVSDYVYQLATVAAALLVLLTTTV